MSKTRIVGTGKNTAGKKSKTNSLKHMTKKVHRTHKGYGMKHIVKSYTTKRSKKR